MKMEKIQLGNKKIMPFTIPSGIVTTEVSCLVRIAQEIPEIGILTTKSIGPAPKAGNREPILAQYIPQGFVNAVGLRNPGAEEFAKKLAPIKIPEDKFLLVSIFGKDAQEFVEVAKILEPYADGFELNLSCPHAKGYGMQLGQDPEIVSEIVAAVKNMTSKPIFAKLTPNTNNISMIAEAAMKAGAYGIVAINTVGPGYYPIDGFPVLTNKVGGLSGRGITPIGLKCIRDITQAMNNVPIIGMGGIATADDIMAYSQAGASFFGIGSALAGMTESEMKEYFSTLVKDIDNKMNESEKLLKSVSMGYKKFKVAEKMTLADDFHILKMDNPLKTEAGQFVFAWLPEKGEKPFSVLDDEPLTIAFQDKGCFTKELATLKEGDDVYFRGPYGQRMSIEPGKKVILIGGGTGIAGIYLFAKQLQGKNPVEVFLGAKNKSHLVFVEEFKKLGKTYAATEDGSEGTKGLVTDLMKEHLSGGCYFFNCGPKVMVDAVLPIELSLSQPEMIYSSMDHMTMCGVGICGSCANAQGKRTCVEGPFMNP